MLNPFQRRHLIDALRPPLNSVLDRAIGTTYSLDLLALLTAPLAFTFFDYEADGSDATPTADPLALLEALRRYADQIAIFCDAGRIIVPRAAQLLYSYLEESVYEVTAMSGGVFHPKLWLLRFVGPGDTVTYRLLCLSRNLTFDRSWDTALALEGVLVPDGVVHPENQPLADFLAQLPERVIGSRAPETLQATIAQMRDELSRVVFELPPGFDALAFHTLGLSAHMPDPFAQPIDRMLIVSPFLTSHMLTRLANHGQNNILIARLEELQTATSVLQRFAAVYRLSDAADMEDAVPKDEMDTSPTLAGLHAKLYVADAGERAHIWTGSANATDAAFTRNVEFLVQLSGARAACGIDAVLGHEHDTGLFALLERFDPERAGEPRDAVQDRLDALVEHWQREIARLGLTARVRRTANPDQFDVHMRVPEDGRRAIPGAVSIICWPTTRGAGSATPINLTGTVAALFRDLSYEGLTTFYAFEVTAREGDKVGQTRFVLNIPLTGAPADRRQRLLRALLQSRAQVLRFLMLLLSDSGSELDGVLRASRTLSDGTQDQSEGRLFGLPLFEAMVRTLDRDPSRLEHIARLVDDLRSPETRHLLPDDFDAIWEPIRAVYDRSTL